MCSWRTDRESQSTSWRSNPGARNPLFSRTDSGTQNPASEHTDPESRSTSWRTVRGSSTNPFPDGRGRGRGRGNRGNRGGRGGRGGAHDTHTSSSDRDILEGLSDAPLLTLQKPTRDSSGREIKIEDQQYIGSYNWVSSLDQPTIIVPGKLCLL